MPDTIILIIVTFITLSGVLTAGFIVFHSFKQRNLQTATVESGEQLGHLKYQTIALANAIDEIMRRLLIREDEEVIFGLIAQKIHEILSVEACAVFLRKEDKENHLQLVASYSDRKGAELIDTEPLEIQSTPNGGLTGYMAKEGNIVTFNRADLDENPFVSGRPADHLVSEMSYSLMGIPIKNRKGYVIGLLKVDNKKGPGRVASRDITFTQTDIAIAKILSAEILEVLEYLETSKTIRSLIPDTQQAPNLDTALVDIATKAKTILGASRIDIALWDRNRGKLVMRTSTGKCSLNQGDCIPKKSIIHSVFKSKQFFISQGDVGLEDNYYKLNNLTQSELAVPLLSGNRVIGVLNCESTFVNFFDQQDVELAKLMAHYAAAAIVMIGREEQLDRLLFGLAHNASGFKLYLKEILTNIETIYGFDAGLIYVLMEDPDNNSQKLECVQHIGCDEIGVTPEEFNYSLQDDSLATHVFQTQEALLADIDDAVVNRMGATHFQIEGPMIALPLVFYGESVGVIILWSRKAVPPVEKDLKRLEPYANIAANKIGVWKYLDSYTYVFPSATLGKTVSA